MRTGDFKINFLHEIPLLSFEPQIRCHKWQAEISKKLRLYFFRPPAFLAKLFPAALWQGPRQEKENEKHVYLTFDDGPFPGATEYIMDTLKRHEVRATFFLLGRQVRKHPLLAKKLVEEGHDIGNHGYAHLGGLFTSQEKYLDDADLADSLIKGIGGEKPRLFRPPYGIFTPWLYRSLKKRYQVVMWDVITGDFDSTLSREACLQKAIKNTRPGSIVVFHENAKSLPKLKYVLPKYLEALKNEGYHFSALN